jgi:hypothetical protein
VSAGDDFANLHNILMPKSAKSVHELSMLLPDWLNNVALQSMTSADHLSDGVLKQSLYRMLPSSMHEQIIKATEPISTYQDLLRYAERAVRESTHQRQIQNETKRSSAMDVDYFTKAARAKVSPKGTARAVLVRRAVKAAREKAAVKTAARENRSAVMCPFHHHLRSRL